MCEAISFSYLLQGFACRAAWNDDGDSLQAVFGVEVAATFSPGVEVSRYTDIVASRSSGSMCALSVSCRCLCECGVYRVSQKLVSFVYYICYSPYGNSVLLQTA